MMLSKEIRTASQAGPVKEKKKKKKDLKEQGEETDVELHGG